jgi:hypothetical protein
MFAKSARFIFFSKGIYGPLVKTIISLIVSQTYMDSSFGLNISEVLEG